MDRSLEGLYNFIWNQRSWSMTTFGEGKRTKGIVKHIQKELVEIEQAPLDVGEWIDVVILALDGAWRTGATIEEVVEALEKKQQINFARNWPKPTSEDDPVEHEQIK